MPFDLDEFLRNNRSVLSSLQWEKYLTTPINKEKPRWLEDIGIKPESVLGEADFKNYLNERNRIIPKPLDPFKPPF